MNDFYQNLTSWYETPQGSCLKYELMNAFQNIWRDYRGKTAIQVEGPCPLLWFKNATFNHYFHFTQHAIPQTPNSIQVALKALPLLEGSVDLLLFPHTFEYCNEIESLLAEAAGVLTGEGRLIIMGFNPYGLWGLHKLMQPKKGVVPWDASFQSPYYLKKILKANHLVVEQDLRFFYRPPFQDPFFLKKWRFIEHVGALCWPTFSGIYFLIAKKEKICATPIKLTWKTCRQVLVTSELP